MVGDVEDLAKMIATITLLQLGLAFPSFRKQQQ